MIVFDKEFSPISSLLNIKNDFVVIAGPCAVESMEQMDAIITRLLKHNIQYIRAGVFKPRTSPYDFQGHGLEGLKILSAIKKKYNVKIVSEILDTRDVEVGCEHIDIIQVGSRNMQNTALLKEVGTTNKPILLKRGMMSTLKEFLLAAEYIASSGNDNLILCERGIRTFENSTRFTLDISSMAIIKEETSLPVIADLSHSLGRKDITVRIANAVIAMGVDGIMIETHSSPKEALSDAKQQMSLDEFDNFFSTSNLTNII